MHNSEDINPTKYCVMLLKSLTIQKYIKHYINWCIVLDSIFEQNKSRTLLRMQTSAISPPYPGNAQSQNNWL